MRRNTAGDVAELSRVTIALMQELDTMTPNHILIGTTNRFDDLDDALKRRFSFKQKMGRLDETEIIKAAKQFFAYCDLSIEEADLKRWVHNSFDDDQNLGRCQEALPIASVVNKCTEYVVKDMLRREYESSD